MLRFSQYTQPMHVGIVLSMIACLMACGGGSDRASTSPNINTNTNTIPVSTPASTPSITAVSDSTPTPSLHEWSANGGSATIPYNSHRPFLTLIPHLDINQSAGVSQGRELFITNWTPAGIRDPLTDGVGPLFNAISCTSCHVDDGRVAPYLADGSTTDGVLFRLGDRQGTGHPSWGFQLQNNVIPNQNGLLAEGSVRAVPEKDAQGRGYYRFVFTPADAQQSLGEHQLGPRIAPQLLGMGLLDLVPESQIIAQADPDDRDGDGISGRVHWIGDGMNRQVGRFGWKAIQPSLRTQIATALHQDMGLTTSVFSYSNCTNAQPLCLAMPNGGSPEVSDYSLQAMTDFMTALSVPARRITNQAQFNQGADLFERVGCAKCHTPTLMTQTSSKFAELSNQKIYAYTDLLLHDMGRGLDDGVKEINAESFEWRTPPLWGIGIVAQDPNARFLHDGRAKTLQEAIAWHGGEAQSANDSFQRLTEQQKALLLQFLQGI